MHEAVSRKKEYFVDRAFRPAMLDSVNKLFVGINADLQFIIQPSGLVG